MDNNRKVKVRSTVNHTVGIVNPDLHFVRNWQKKGAEISIPFDTLEELLYDPGVEFMFKEGMLYIDDLQTKIDLGLEPDGATKSVNIVLLTDEEKNKMLTLMSVDKFKEKVPTLSETQLQELIDYAVAHKIVNLEKNNVLKELTGRDIIKTVQLKEEVRIAEEKEKAARGDKANDAFTRSF